MGLETTNPAPLKVFPTTLGVLASIAGTVLVGRASSLFFYRLDKLDRSVLGHQSVAPGA